MLTHLTIDKLAAPGLGAMATGLADQLAAPGVFNEPSFEDRLGLLVDKGGGRSESRSLDRPLKAARLRYPAALEDIDWRSPRELDRSTVASLSQSGWIAAYTQPGDHRPTHLLPAHRKEVIRHRNKPRSTQ